MYGLIKLKKTNTDKNINREDSLSIFLFQKNFQKNKKFLRKSVDSKGRSGYTNIVVARERQRPLKTEQDEPMCRAL